LVSVCRSGYWIEVEEQYTHPVNQASSHLKNLKFAFYGSENPRGASKLNVFHNLGDVVGEGPVCK
jgi:hypothetical protein